MMPRGSIISSPLFRVLLASIIWIGVISSLHAYLNGERQGVKILMGYMPVITNLAAPLVDAASKEQELEFKAVKFASFAEMADAFRSGHIQVGFIIAPLAIALRQQGVPLKIVYIGNRHESTLVIRKDMQANSLRDIVGKRIAVPIRFSGHLLALNRTLRQYGLSRSDIQLVEIPPPDMPAALSSGGIDGYFVGEPFAARSITSGIGKKLVHVEDIWPKFICNLMIVREDLIQSHPDRVQSLVTAAVRSGIWAKDHIEEATDLACSYWGQDRKTVSYAFSNPQNRCRFDLYTPIQAEMEEIREEMERAGLIEPGVNLNGLVDDRFARAALTDRVGSFRDILSH